MQKHADSKEILMTTVELLIKNGTVLTMDENLTVHTNGYVGVKNGQITQLGNGVPKIDATQVIDAKKGLILPGLINAHTHAAMCLFRGLADDLPLMEWLNHYIFPAEQKMDAEFVYVGTQLACAEMILAGTTTFCDMYLFTEEVAKAAHDAGMRCLVGEVLYDFPSPNYGPIEAGMAYTEELILRWREDPLVSIAVEPHSLYTCSPQLLIDAQNLAAKHDVPLIIHLSESANEVEEVLNRYNRRPVAHLATLGLLSPRLIADHVVHVTAYEMDTLAENGVRVVHNPESNLKLASGIAPVSELINRGVPVALGTDGCASNNNLDLFEEMDTAAKIAKIHHLDPTRLNALTVLKMVTIEGARVLGMADRIGSLEIGKQADIIVIDTCQPHLTPLYNPYSQLVYAAGGRDVRDVIINGQLVMENRRLLTLDLAGTLARSEEKAALVRKWVSSNSIQTNG